MPCLLKESWYLLVRYVLGNAIVYSEVRCVKDWKK